MSAESGLYFSERKMWMEKPDARPVLNRLTRTRRRAEKAEAALTEAREQLTAWERQFTEQAKRAEKAEAERDRLAAALESLLDAVDHAGTVHPDQVEPFLGGADDLARAVLDENRRDE